MEILLIGNSFPMNLITRDVIIKPKTVAELRKEIKIAEEIYSFWGHGNTVKIASNICGTDLNNKGNGIRRERVSITSDGLPSFGGLFFRECWILTPEYVRSFRPEIGEEVAVDMIKKWRALRMVWI